jgi:hypothetical protein
MGILIRTTFDTPHGFTVTDVYCRITRVTFDPAPGGDYVITLKYETHLSRDRRLAGALPLSIPDTPELLSTSGVMGDMTYVYGRLKEALQGRGFTVEDVLEASQQSSG